MERPVGPVVYVSVAKQGHHRTMADLLAPADPPAPLAGASITERMRHRLRTAVGKAQYALRKQTVEPEEIRKQKVRMVCAASAACRALTSVAVAYGL